MTKKLHLCYWKNSDTHPDKVIFPSSQGPGPSALGRSSPGAAGAGRAPGAAPTFCLTPAILHNLARARSRLHRRHILQVNTRWKALAEIYNIYLLLHRSDLKISAKNRQHFLANE